MDGSPSQEGAPHILTSLAGLVLVHLNESTLSQAEFNLLKTLVGAAGIEPATPAV